MTDYTRPIPDQKLTFESNAMGVTIKKYIGGEVAEKLYLSPDQVKYISERFAERKS